MEFYHANDEAIFYPSTQILNHLPKRIESQTSWDVCLTV